MKLKDLKILQKVLKHIRRRHPKYVFKLHCETKFFFYISVSEPECFANKEFAKDREFVKRLHGRNISKVIMFITYGQYIKRK